VPDVSVVVPFLNAERHIARCLEALESQLPFGGSFEVVRVDNGSTDGSAQYLAERWPEVRVVELPENAGFPAAINRGIEASRGEYIALLNNDLELSADWLERLAGELDQKPGLGFVTGKILRFAERDVIEQAGHDFYTCGMFAPRGLDEQDTGQYDEPARTAIVTAAAAMYRRDAVGRVGAFDEDYFLYCEDADLCLRILLAGYGGLYVPGPEAYHVRGGTAPRDSRRTSFFLFRNALITLLKDMPGSLLLASLPKILLYQYVQYRTARDSGIRGVFRQAWASFLRVLAPTLRKRRAVQGQRAIPVEVYRSLLRTEYPLPTRLGRLVGRRLE
jgi:GT2 family glycosyltransferase